MGWFRSGTMERCRLGLLPRHTSGGEPRQLPADVSGIGGLIYSRWALALLLALAAAGLPCRAATGTVYMSGAGTADEFTYTVQFVVDGVAYAVSESGRVTDSKGRSVTDEDTALEARLARGVYDACIAGPGSLCDAAVTSALSLEPPACTVSEAGTVWATLPIAMAIEGAPDVSYDAERAADRDDLSAASDEAIRSGLRASLEHPSAQAREAAHAAFSIALDSYQANASVVREIRDELADRRLDAIVRFSYDDAEEFLLNWYATRTMPASVDLLEHIDLYERRAGKYALTPRTEATETTLKAARSAIDGATWDAETLSMLEGILGVSQELGRLGVGLFEYPPYREFASTSESIWRDCLSAEALSLATAGGKRTFDLGGLGSSVARCTKRFEERDARAATLLAASGEDAPVTDAVDLVLVVDATGSMDAEIADMSEHVSTIVATVARATDDFRVAVITYGDRDDAGGARTGHLQAWAFSSRGAAIENNVRSITADGGGDDPEDVYDGLLAAIEASDIGTWRAGAHKLVILMGDAPPKERPDGPTVDDVVRRARDAGHVDIHALVAGGAPDVMKAFAAITSRCGGRVVPTDSPTSFAEDLANALAVALRSEGLGARPGIGGGIAGSAPAAKGGPTAGAGRRTALVGLVIVLGTVVVAALVLGVALLLRAPRRLSGDSAWLLVLSGPQSGRRHHIGSGMALIGAAPESDVWIPDPAVSGRHAALVRREHGWDVEDLGSKNGTYVNGTRQSLCRLDDGDIVVVGETQVRFGVR